MTKKIEELQAFDTATYEAIDLNRLVIYTMVELEKLGVDLSLENIVVGAFMLFPSKFSLVGYSQYPDATRVEKALWRCKGKSKQWIGGKTPHGYLITERTRVIATQTERQLTSHTSRKRKPSSRLRRKEGLLKEVLNSSAYLKYISGNKELISEGEFCYLLQATLDSSRETLRENLNSLQLFSEELEHEEAKTFLDWIEQRFKELL